MRVVWIGAGTVVLAACFSKPTFQGNGDANRDGTPATDAGTPTVPARVTVTGNGIADPITISTSEIALGIPNTELRYPATLRLGQRDVLGHASNCQNGGEDGVGLGIYPAVSVTAVPSLWTGTPPTTTVAVTATGPAFGQVTAAFTGGSYSCGGTQAVSGQSTFTVFPDGRIVRDDRISPTTSTTPDSTGAGVTCGCGTSDLSYFVTSFISLDNGAFDRAVYEYAGGGISDETFPIVQMARLDDDNPPWACAEHRSTHRRLGVAWPTPPTTPNGGTRIKAELDATTLLFDWINNNTRVTPGMYTTQSVWFASNRIGSTCDPGEMRALTAAYASPRQMSIGPTMARSLRIELDPNTGIYDARAQASSATWYVGVDNGALTGIPAGHAITLPFPSTTRPRVIVDGVELVADSHFYWQLTSTTPPLHSFWFPGQLGPASVITFEQ